MKTNILLCWEAARDFGHIIQLSLSRLFPWPFKNAVLDRKNNYNPLYWWCTILYPATLQKLFNLCTKVPIFRSNTLFIYSCITSPLLWIKLVCRPRAPTHCVARGRRVHWKQCLIQTLANRGPNSRFILKAIFKLICRSLVSLPEDAYLYK